MSLRYAPGLQRQSCATSPRRAASPPCAVPSPDAPCLWHPPLQSMRNRQRPWRLTNGCAESAPTSRRATWTATPASWRGSACARLRCREVAQRGESSIAALLECARQFQPQLANNQCTKCITCYGTAGENGNEKKPAACLSLGSHCKSRIAQASRGAAAAAGARRPWARGPCSGRQAASSGRSGQAACHLGKRAACEGGGERKKGREREGERGNETLSTTTRKRRTHVL